VGNLRKIANILAKGTIFLLATTTFFCAIALFLLNSNKKELVEKVVQTLRDDYHLELAFDEIDVSVLENWPELGIRMKQISLSNRHQNVQREPCLKAASIHFSLNARKLIRGEVDVRKIKIQNAVLCFLNDSLGQSNYDFQSSSSAFDAGYSFLLKVKEFVLRNVLLEITNVKTGKHFSCLFNDETIKLNDFGGNLQAVVEGNMKVNELLLNPAKGPMLRNKQIRNNIFLTFSPRLNRILIGKNSEVEIENQNYALKAVLDFVLQKLSLYVRAEVKDFQKTISILNPKTQQKLSVLHVTHPLFAKALIVLRMGREEDPLLKIQFWGNGNNVTLGMFKVPYTHLKYFGEINCLPDSLGVSRLEKATIRITDIKGKVHGFPFSASISIDNLVDPYIRSQAQLTINSKKIKFNPGRDFDLSGVLVADILYEGPAKGLKNHTFLNAPMYLNAMISFNNMTFKTKVNHIPFTIQGKARVLNDQISFDNVLVSTLGGEFRIKGKAQGFTSYVFDLRDGFKAQVVAKSPFFDLNPLMMKSVIMSEKHDKKKRKLIKSKGPKFEFDLQLILGRFLIRKLNTYGATAKIHYLNEKIKLHHLNLTACGGTLLAQGVLNNFTNASAIVQVQNMDMHSLFEQCENFGQRALTSENVSGILSATSAVVIDFKEQFSVVEQSIIADIQAVVKNGHLIRYEPLQKVSRFLFRKKKLDDIAFSELNPVLRIVGSQVNIQRMDILSNVLNLSVHGVYNFKDQLSINLLLPWNNLRPHKRDLIQRRAIEKIEEGGKGLKLNLYGYPHQMKVRMGHR
jgi:hypothetical protein